MQGLLSGNLVIVFYHHKQKGKMVSLLTKETMIRLPYFSKVVIKRSADNWCKRYLFAFKKYFQFEMPVLRHCFPTDISFCFSKCNAQK